MIKKPEILAPAGAEEQLFAAVRCGADAVYLGAQNFNARRNASNFNATSLEQAVSYCHARNVRVHVTCNILVKDSEMALLEETADSIASAGADAVILQDMAAVELFADRYPTIERHASTQAAVHDLSGALYMQDLGFTNVVLARELTLEEIAHITGNLSIQTETFVHGAHCMSVSGMCYFSGMLGGRSGNRGLCAQPCRLDWRCGGKEHCLSLKDMSLISHLQELQQAGVSTFKIEGRMKRPEYVAAAVTACRAALDGNAYDEDSLRRVFSRSGFTDGYLTNRMDSDMFGYRTRDDVTDSNTILNSLHELYKAERPTVPVAMTFFADTAKSELTVNDGTHSVSVKGDVPQTAIHRPMDEASVAKSLSKTGGTPFILRNISSDIRGNIMLPASSLNALRRAALEELLSVRSAPAPHPVSSKEIRLLTQKHEPPEETKLWARFYSTKQLPKDDCALERIVLPVSEITGELLERYGHRLVAELPAVCFPGDEEPLSQRLRVLQHSGLNAVLTENVYGLRLSRSLGLACIAGAGMNILNTGALCHYEKDGIESAVLSFELSMKELSTIGGSIPRGIVGYGRLPLMRYRNCPVRASVGCKKCGGAGKLTDRTGAAFPVECGGKKYSTLLNSVPLHIADKTFPAFDFLLLYFTVESATDCENILQDYVFHRRSPLPRTGGLYYRELL